MKKSELLNLLLKVLGVYLILTIIGNINQLVSVFYFSYSSMMESEYMPDIDYAILFLLPVVTLIITLTLTYLCLFKSSAFASILLKNENDSELNFKINNKNQFIDVSLVLAGLITIIWSIPELILNIKEYSISLSSVFTEIEPDLSFITLSTIRIILGFVIIKYSSQVASKIQ